MAPRWTRASSPYWAASTPTPPAASPPTLHIPCSPDMIERPSRCSTTTPWAFMATSLMPATAPYSRSVNHSTARFGARAGRASAADHIAMSHRVAVRPPNRWMIRPAIGIATRDPTAGASSARPSSPGPACRWSWNQGMRVAKLPVTAPWTAKVTETATRALLTARESTRES